MLPSQFSSFHDEVREQGMLPHYPIKRFTFGLKLVIEKVCDT